MNIKMRCAPLIVLAAAMMGCSTGGPKLPKYVAPNLPAEQVATIKGHGGTNVVSIDQAEVSGSGFQMGNWGGNHVRVTPGKHRIVVRQANSTSTSFSSSAVAFEHDFLAGHAYKIGPASLFDREMELVDETIGKSKRVAN